MGVLFLVTAFPVSAEFKPRDRKPASGNSRPAGSRGCSNSGIPITQLAPQTFIGKTALTRPMFVWYMSSSQTVRFRLFELESTPKQIGEPKEIPTIVGINKLKLPLDYPELKVGKTYLWQIASDCENDVIVSRAEFIVINAQSLPKKQYTSIPENVNYYTENELWYEALEEALKIASNGISPIVSTLVQDLAKSEISSGKEANIQKTKQRVEVLQKISTIGN